MPPALPKLPNLDMVWLAIPIALLIYALLLYDTRRAGINTAGYVSGYRGSPLGGYDQQLWAAKKILDEHHVVFQPGVNT